MCTGNFAFLNWLTIAPAILYLDDYFWLTTGWFKLEDITAAVYAETKYR